MKVEWLVTSVEPSSPCHNISFVECDNLSQFLCVCAFDQNIFHNNEIIFRTFHIRTKREAYNIYQHISVFNCQYFY